MKPDAIKTGVMPGGARIAARISEKHTANLPNDFGKSRREKSHGRFGLMNRRLDKLGLDLHDGLGRYG